MDHRGGAGAPANRSAGGEFLLSLLQKSQPSPPSRSTGGDPAVAAVGPSLQSPLFPPNFFLQGFPQQQQPPQPQQQFGFQQNQMRFGNLPSEALLNRTGTDNNNNNRDLDLNELMMRNFDSELGFSGNSRSSSRSENRDSDLAGLMKNLDVANRNSELGFSGNSHSSSYDRRGNGDYHGEIDLDRGNNITGLGRQNHGVIHHQHKSVQAGGLGRQDQRSMQNGEFSRQVGNRSFDDDIRGLNGRQYHGVIHHSSMLDGQFSRQERVVGHRSSNGGELGRQEHVVGHRYSNDGELGRQEHVVGHRSSNDGELGRQERVVGHRSSNNGELGRQERVVGHRSSNDGELGRQERVVGHRSSNDVGFSRQERGGGGVDRTSQVMPRPPPGFLSNPRRGGNVGDRNGGFEDYKSHGDARRNSGHVDQIGSRGGRNWDNGNRRRNSEQNVGGKNGGFGEFNTRVNTPIDEFNSHGDAMRRRGINDQFDIPGPPTGSKLHSVKASGVEESLMKLHAESDEIADEHKVDTGNGKDVDESNDNNDKKKAQNSRDKYARSDTRGNWLLSQKMRNMKKQMICRPDIDMLNAPFHKIFETLVPTEEEKAKQKQLMTQLEGLVCKEWPEAQLYLYGSCANSFGVSKSDIDVCLAIDDAEINKSEFLMRLAEILESDNLQNVQALTRARVPIVKLMDPVTGISCDICINNVLAVVNTKLLRDYTQIDGRLRHLGFIVKHWAKSRGVNETYQGTLSSYAYVLMCIHFLQQRRPAVLPCLQGLEPTYSVTVDDVKCTYFDRIESLRGFGSNNKESIAQLVWGFFIYWAYCHDYANNAISIRTGTIISKQSKDWTTRVGNDRHLICIEDPFEISHDLGRVVDKYSIKVLREEFERAAHILQYDPNPCVNLFEPYVPEGRLSNP